MVHTSIALVFKINH